MTPLEQYKKWHIGQREEVKSFINGKPKLEDFPKGIVSVIFPYYRENREFRQTIRELFLTDPAVRIYRKQQVEELFNTIEYIYWLYGLTVPPQAVLYAFILNLENLADAIVRGDFEALGISEEEALKALEGIVASLLSSAIATEQYSFQQSS